MSYIYLIQEREHIRLNEPTYKIGKTHQKPGARMGAYPKDSSLKIMLNFDNCDTAEKQLLAIFKKYSDFNLVVLNEDLAKKIDSCKNFDLKELEELKSFNGTLVYKLIDEKNDELIASQTFANISKVSNGNEVFVISKNEKIKRVLKIDENLHGTIAILKTKNNENIFDGYKYRQVKIEKVEA